MAHYIVKGSLRERGGSTPPEWLKVSSEMGRVANDWAFRSDLVVYSGKLDEGTSARYRSNLAEIEIDIDQVFGKIDPTTIGDFTDTKTQREFPLFSGILFHESLHARFSNWDWSQASGSLDDQEVQAFLLLDEARIEGKGVKERPANKNFLRYSALHLSLSEILENGIGGSEVWHYAKASVLAIARVDSGVLEVSDVQALYLEAVEALGKELFDELRKVWIEFQELSTPEIEKAIVLAKKWVELLRQADPEGEPQMSGSPLEESEGEGEGEEESEGKGEGNSEALQKMLDTLAQSADQTETNTQQSMAEQAQQDRWNESNKSKANETKQKNQRKAHAKQIYDKLREVEGKIGSGSRISEKRPPTGEERASAVSIAKSLEKAKYRERSEHIRKTNLPMGKLSIRNAIQNKAMEANGLRGELPAWKQKSRKHTDDPTLRLGIMVDISGSMGGAMEATGSTAWIMSEAGRRIQAKTSMMYYGSDIFPTLRIGERLSEVRIFTAPDGTEKFGEAWSALDGELGLTYGDGVRMLVIVSDGNYTPKQTERAKQILAECRQNSVAVLWVSPRGASAWGAREIIRESNWGVLLEDLEVKEIARLVGKSASEALGKVGSLT